MVHHITQIITENYIKKNDMFQIFRFFSYQGAIYDALPKKSFEFDSRYKNYSITFDNVFNNDIALLKILNYFS